MQVQYGETNKQKVIAESISSKLGNGGSRVRLKLNKPIEYNRLYMGCFKKEDLIEVGLYDDSDVVISEDSLMNYKLIKNKKNLFFSLLKLNTQQKKHLLNYLNSTLYMEERKDMSLTTTLVKLKKFFH